MSEAEEIEGKRRPEDADLPKVIRLVSEGKSLRAACRRLGLDPPSTHTWLDADDARRQQYALAKEQRAEVLAEKALKIGLDASKGLVKADGARVALDAVKWASARMAPKTAPVTRIAHSFDDLTSEERRRRIAELKAELDADDGRQGG